MTQTCIVCNNNATRFIGGVLLCTNHATAITAEIDNIRATGGSVDVAKIAHKMREPDNIPQFAPSSDAVLAYLRCNNITGSQAARMMYLSGSNQVRKYTGGAKPRQMDGARWFCIHAHKMLTPEQIAEIEAAMLSDLHI